MTDDPLEAIRERHAKSTMGDWCKMEGYPYPCRDRRDADALAAQRLSHVDRHLLREALRTEMISMGTFAHVSRAAEERVLDRLADAVLAVPGVSEAPLRERIEALCAQMETWPVQTPKAIALNIRAVLDPPPDPLETIRQRQIVVNRAQVAAAQLIMYLDRQDGNETDPRIRKIANADEACPRCGHMPHQQPCLNMASDNECDCPGVRVTTPT